MLVVTSTNAERVIRDGGSVFTAHAKPGAPNGPRGLAANESVCALISTIVRRTARSIQRPDTEVAPVSWTPDYLGSRSPRWPPRLATVVVATDTVGDCGSF